MTCTRSVPPHVPCRTASSLMTGFSVPRRTDPSSRITFTSMDRTTFWPGPPEKRNVIAPLVGSLLTWMYTSVPGGTVAVGPGSREGGTLPAGVTVVAGTTGRGTDTGTAVRTMYIPAATRRRIAAAPMTLQGTGLPREEGACGWGAAGGGVEGGGDDCERGGAVTGGAAGGGACGGGGEWGEAPPDERGGGGEGGWRGGEVSGGADGRDGCGGGGAAGGAGTLPCGGDGGVFGCVTSCRDGTACGVTTSCAAPHFGQNCVSSGIFAPHCVQKTISPIVSPHLLFPAGCTGVPHFRQNLAPAGRVAPQDGHVPGSWM